MYMKKENIKKIKGKYFSKYYLFYQAFIPYVIPVIPESRVLYNKSWFIIDSISNTIT